MTRIADSSLEEIRQRIDIVDLVREYVPTLKQAGRNHKACCPFHQERTPSFMVNPDKQIFHCFGCQAGGDVFSFLMKVEGLTFPEAATKLGERAGVRVAQPEAQLGPQEKERIRLRNALEFAREFYHGQLVTSPEAEPARRYLAKRGLNKRAVERFGLGYAPRAGQFVAAAARKGYGPELLVKAGLAAPRQAGGHRDYFWARILYPISNAKGEVSGFGARATGDAEPKYLNSPDTPLFSKGRVLYGLYEGLASLRKGRRALILEGYMDVIALHQFGFEHACAPLGTALTEDHVLLLKRYVSEAVIVFDPDAAGAAAALRGADLMLERGLAVRIATMPDGLDPDEVLHQRGVPALEACLDSAQDLADFRTDLALQGKSQPLGPEEKSRIAGQVLEVVRKSQDEVLKREWLRRLAQRLKLDEESLHLQLKRGEAAPDRSARRAPVAEKAGRLPAEEEEILLCLTRLPGLALKDELVAEEDFSHARSRAVFAALRRAFSETGAESWPVRLADLLEPADAALARAMLVDGREVADPAAAVSELVGRMRRKKRLLELEPLVLRMGSDAPVDAELQGEYSRLLTELKGIRKGD